MFVAVEDLSTGVDAIIYAISASTKDILDTAKISSTGESYFSWMYGNNITFNDSKGIYLAMIKRQIKY